MTNDAIEIGWRHFCREQTTGDQFPGVFHIDADEMSVTLYSFDKPVSLTVHDPLVLRLENNSIASLHQNVSLGEGTRYAYGRVAHSHRVISNAVVIGSDAWSATDPVRRVQFRIEHAEDLMRHDRKFDAIAAAEFRNMPDRTVFDLSTAGPRVSVRYEPSGPASFGRATAVGVHYSVEFDEPVDLKSYLTIVNCIVRFVSSTMGFKFVPSDIQISRLSNADLLKALADGSYGGDHDVRYIWRKEAPTQSLSLGDCFVQARNDGELAKLIQALNVWINRDAEWRSANDLMMGCFGLQRTMSGERLLTACRWLEEIPGASPAIAVSATDIDAIACAAAVEAERLGHKDYKKRIAGMIRAQLKTESNAERFERLRATVCARFGNHALPIAAAVSLRNAMEFRGRVAHGAFDPLGDPEFQAFAKSVHAMEALCYLLTIKDLPMTEEGARRAPGIEIAAQYRYWS